MTVSADASALGPSPARVRGPRSEGDRSDLRGGGDPEEADEEDVDRLSHMPAGAVEEPTGAKLHRQFHARKQQLHAFLWAVLVLVSLSWLITLSNNGTLVARQKLEGKALDSFPPSEGEPTLADRFAHFIEQSQKRCDGTRDADPRWLVWQGGGPSFADHLFSMASTFSWALSTGRIFTVLPPETATEMVHNWDSASPCWTCYVVPLSTCPFPAGAAGGEMLPSAAETEVDGPAPIVSFSRMSLNRGFLNGTIFEDQSELWITAQLFRFLMRLSEEGSKAVEKEEHKIGWPEGNIHGVVGVHTRTGDAATFTPVGAKKGSQPGKKPVAAPHPLTAYAAAVKWVVPLTGDGFVYVGSAEVGVCDALTDVLYKKMGDSVQVLCQAELTKEEAFRPEAVFEQWFVDLVLLSRTNFLIGCQSAATARVVLALQTARLAAAGVPVIAPSYDLDNAVWFGSTLADGQVASAGRIWHAMQADIRSSIVQVADLGGAATATAEEEPSAPPSPVTTRTIGRGRRRSSARR